jgi:branched-subunit amino acid transport protein
MINKKTINLLGEWKELIINTCIAIACLVLLIYFPSKGLSQDLSRTIFFLLILPILYIKLVLKKKLKDFGASLAINKEGFIWFLGALAASFIIMFLIIYFTDFKKNYVIPDYVMASFWVFLLGELVIYNYYFFQLEAFFRGFVLFTFFPKLGYLSILAAVLFTYVFLYLSQSISWGSTPYMIATLTGTVVAYKTRSFIYSYFMGLLFIISLDAYLIYSFKTIH